MTFTIKWVGPPASYTPGRARPAQFITLHTTEGSEGPTSAENGVAYDKRRTDGTSCHYFTDSEGAALCEVRDADRSHSALWHGNEIGIHIEIFGRAGQSGSQWADAASRATLETTAQLVAHLCKAHGFPARRLSVAETRAAYYGAAGKRPKGINDHYTITRAFPEDGGTHTDVGPNFPWALFLGLVAEAMGDEVAELFVKAGDKSEGVKYLQRRLVRLSYLKADQVTGTYDSATTAAVKKYRTERLDKDDVGAGTSVTGWMVNSMDEELAKIRAKGAKGDPGPAGPAGKDGAPGEPGPTIGQHFTVEVVEAAPES